MNYYIVNEEMIPFVRNHEMKLLKKTVLRVFLKHTDFFAVTAILFLSIILRTIHLPERISWQDTGTEFLTAYHVATFDEYPLLGVAASSINFFHPPWYLYGLGWLMRIFGGYEPLIYLSSGVHALTVIPLYFIGLWVFNRRVGLLSALLYAISGWAISLSGTLQSQNIIAPIGVSVLAFWLYARRQKNTFLLLLSIFALLFAATVNYAAIMLLPIPFFVGINDRKTLVFDIFVWILIWLFFFALLFYPLFLYFEVSKTLLNLGSIPFLFMAGASKPMSHHVNIFAPFASLLISWTLIFLWNRNKAFGWHILLVVGTTSVITNNLVQTYSDQKGDYQETLACTQTVIQAMEKTLDDSPRVVIKDREHKDKWDHMTVLFELALGKKLVALGPKRDYFYWPKSNKNIYLLCLGTGNNRDDFFTKICPQEFAADNPSYHLLEHIPQDTSLPCGLYRFSRDNL